VKYLLDSSREGGSLVIGSREERNLLVLSIRCECAGHVGQQNTWVLDLEGKRQGSSLTRLDQSLKNVFGQSCGVISRNREDGLPGMEIQVRLPLHSNMTER